MAQYPGYFNYYVLGSLRPGERILVESISDQSTLSDPPLRAVDTTLPAVTAPEYEVEDDTLRYTRRCKKQVADALQQFAISTTNVKQNSGSVFSSTQLAERSYIIDGIEDAANFLNNGSGPRVLVIFTDGIEDSEEYSHIVKFDAPNFWKTNSADSLVSELKSENRIPNLNGTHVYLVGAAADSPEAYRSNAAFWATFFRAAGVSDKDMHYGHSPSWSEQPTENDMMTTLCGAMQ
jgi:hypothetical protein